MKKPFYLLLSVFLFSCGCNCNKTKEVTFSVVGDMPYGEDDEQKLIDIIDAQNVNHDVNFMVHVGDIKEGDSPCDFYYYDRFKEIMSKSMVPALAIPGDNEWTDCEDQKEAYKTWEQLLTYSLDSEVGASPIRQQGMPSNFAFLSQKNLFIGLTLPDADEEDYEDLESKLKKNVDWLEDRMSANVGSVDMLIIFAHSKPTKEFGFRDKVFELCSTYFSQQRVLWIQGDDHEFEVKKKWKGTNIDKITVDQDMRVKITAHNGNYQIVK